MLEEFFSDGWEFEWDFPLDDFLESPRCWRLLERAWWETNVYFLLIVAFKNFKTKRHAQGRNYLRTGFASAAEIWFYIRSMLMTNYHSKEDGVAWYICHPRQASKNHRRYPGTKSALYCEFVSPVPKRKRYIVWARETCRLGAWVDHCLLICLRRVSRKSIVI